MVMHATRCTEPLTLYPLAEGPGDFLTIVSCAGCDLTGLVSLTRETIDNLLAEGRAVIGELPEPEPDDAAPVLSEE